MHDKTKFAKPPQERYLSLGQIRKNPKKYKNMAKIEKSGIGMFLNKLITDVNMSCKSAKYCT